ncbi:hypothetical protein [Chitinophaga sp. S165]|uniref:hypothetical protein n=1 Tax=Chitinophaga sp. S165 TaxID=2135462 RepID=UPI000D71844C|nr:hypothetical protein [Chitinophaga sp. S165]PWV56231.1 hypothetical protein C7475_101746 [Chitinophaga sp. S165]
MSELFTNLYNAYFTLSGADKYIIGKQRRIVSQSENAYLLHLETRDVTYLNWFYGNPTCGLISENEDWAVMAGDFELTVWYEGEHDEEEVITIDTDPVFDMRQKDEETVELLVGILYLDAAVWELNIKTMQLRRTAHYTDYFNREYLSKCTIVGAL